MLTAARREELKSSALRIHASACSRSPSSRYQWASVTQRSDTVGLQRITCGLASLGVSRRVEHAPSACRKVAPTLWRGCSHRGLFGPLVHQASIAVLFPANGILICLEQRLGLGPNDSAAIRSNAASGSGRGSGGPSGSSVPQPTRSVPVKRVQHMY